MEIKIVQNSAVKTGTYLGNYYILESVESVGPNAQLPTIKYYVYDIRNNTKEEIAPNLVKYKLGGIYQICKAWQYVYFLTASESAKKEQGYDASLMRYNIEDGCIQEVVSFQSDLRQHGTEFRLRMYIMDDAYVIFQRELRTSVANGSYEGFFTFDLKLYNIEEKQEYPILDENLLKNGINSMFLVSDTIAVMKTGFSLLEDSRAGLLSKEEVSVEGICYFNIRQFLSDVMIGKTNIDVEMVDQAFYNRTFPYLYASEDYIVYSGVDLEQKEEEVVFYNFQTKERKTCRNKNVYRNTDLTKAFVINNQPYVLIMKEDGIEFTNIDTMKNDIAFDKSQFFNNAKGGIFILSGEKKKGFFCKNMVPYFDVYAVPKKHLLSERGKYLFHVHTEKDEIYIFTE